MLSEKEIISGCRQHEKSCQYELVKRYSGMLMTVCRRYAGDDATAKDMLQESLIRIFSAIDRYEPTGSFEAWMRTITIRCSLKWLSSKGFRHDLPGDDIPENGKDDPDLEGNLEMEMLIGEIQSLSPTLRAVFNLSVLEGYSHAEIANMLGIGESTSRTNLLRARQQLQKKIIAANAVKQDVI